MQNPENPYSNSPAYNPSVAPGAYSGRTPEISFDAIGQAWKLLQPNIGVWIGAFLIYIVMIGILSGIQGATLGRDSNGMPQFGLLYFVVNLIIFVVAQLFVGGLFRMAIGNVRTGRADLGQMFSAVDVFPNLLVAGILTAIATVIGFVFCVVPGFLLSGLFMFVIPLIVDKRQSAIEAITSSMDALKPQMWMALLFILVVSLMASAGALACGVGMLVTAPLALLTIAVTYNNFFGGGQSPIQNQMPPSAPIADPFK